MRFWRRVATGGLAPGRGQEKKGATVAERAREALQRVEYIGFDVCFVIHFPVDGICVPVKCHVVVLSQHLRASEAQRVFCSPLTDVYEALPGPIPSLEQPENLPRFWF